MRRARVTYQGAYHHVMNRGILGKNIFQKEESKKYFLTILKAAVHRIKILAYCIMDNHYHLILQNTSNKLTEFIKQINAQYGTYYRKSHGGRGYVFQDRYKSTLIQKDKYLRTALCYLLLNPVRAGIAKVPGRYKWTSMREYFTNRKGGITDKAEVEGIYRTNTGLIRYMESMEGKELEERHTRIGMVLGDEGFIEKAFELYERRGKRKGTRRQRISDYIFEPVEKVIKEFEKETDCRLKDINTTTWPGKRLRGMLLVRLKEEVGLKYGEILKMPLFKELKYNSMGELYRRAKEKN